MTAIVAAEQARQATREEWQFVDTSTYISLFSGAGGLDLSVRLAIPGARCVCFVEREAPAAAILAARMEDGSAHEAPIWSDVRTFDGRPWRGRVGGIIGGFPCTDLSVAGRQAGIHGEASGLFFEYCRIIREVQPRWVFIENVPPVLAFPSGGIVLGELAELGFDAEWGTLRASDVGAPHRRERAFILAYADVDDPRRPERWPNTAARGDSCEGSDRRWEEASRARESNSAVADAERSRWAAPWCGREEHPGREPEPRCGVVGDPAGPRRPRWEPGESGAVRDGAWRAESGGRCDGLGAGAELGNTECLGRIEDIQREPSRDVPYEGSGNNLPLSPPGPSDADAWQRILRDHPYLAPAVESGVRVLVNGVAVVVDESRTDQLRAGGNGVVAIQGAAAFTVLARRAGLRF